MKIKSKQTKTFLQGSVIFQVGDLADCAYIVESGVVGVYSDEEDKTQIATIETGELLGEMGIIDNTSRSVSAFAETDVELMVIDKAQITKRLENSDPIIRGLMEVLLRRIRNMLQDRNVNIQTPGDNNVVSQGLHKIRFEKELFQAFENNEIINVYQPMVDLQTGKIAGFEALSRWEHPQKGMVSPFEFISLAEESDLIVTLGMKAFENACEQLSVFQAHANHTVYFMSINVSAAQLAEHTFLADIVTITKKYEISPNQIKIEITESLVVDYPKVQKWMDECRHLGFKLSLDDFGTGYSGFLHLLELDFHTLKIDQAFTKTLAVNPKSLIMLEVIIGMAKRMGINVVAEGIENSQQAHILTSIGVDYGQGYYFFKPMTAKDVIPLLAVDSL